MPARATVRTHTSVMCTEGSAEWCLSGRRVWAWLNTYLHLKEGRPKGRPAADPLQELHLGLCHCLVFVFVTFQKEALMEKGASEDLGRLLCPPYRAWTPRGSETQVRATPTYLEVSVG